MHLVGCTTLFLVCSAVCLCLSVQNDRLKSFPQDLVKLLGVDLGPYRGIQGHTKVKCINLGHFQSSKLSVSKSDRKVFALTHTLNLFLVVVVCQSILHLQL